MNRRKFISDSSKLVAVGAATAIAGCGGSSGPESVSISIDSFGEWSGSIGGASGSRSVQGRGRESYRFREVPDVVSATIQKGTRDRSKLTVSIIADGDTVKQSSTEAEYGVASVSHSFF